MKNRILKSVLIFSLIILHLACSTNAGTTIVGNTTIVPSALTIGQLSSGESLVTIPLSVFGSSTASLIGSSLDVLVNGTLRTGLISAEPLFNSAQQAVLYTATGLSHGDSLRIILRRADRTTTTYDGFVSLLSSTEAALTTDTSSILTAERNLIFSFALDGITTTLSYDLSAYAGYAGDDVADADGREVYLGYTASVPRMEWSDDLFATDDQFTLHLGATGQTFYVDRDPLSAPQAYSVEYLAFLGSNLVDKSSTTFALTASSSLTFSSDCTVDFVRDTDFYVDTTLSDAEIQDQLDHGAAIDGVRNIVSSAHLGRMTLHRRQSGEEDEIFSDMDGVIDDDGTFVVDISFAVSGVSRSRRVEGVWAADNTISYSLVETYDVDTLGSCSVTYSTVGVAE